MRQPDIDEINRTIEALEAQSEYLEDRLWLGVHEAMLARQAWGHLIDALNALAGLMGKMKAREKGG